MASRREQKETARLRREQLEREHALRASRVRRLRWTGGGLAATALLAGLAAFVLTSGGGNAPAQRAAAIPPVSTADLTVAAKRAGATFTEYDYAYGTGNHVTSKVKYPMNPPTNGPHYPVPASDGDYVGVATPRTEALVHSLEHGRIEIQYRPGLPQAQIDQLVALYEEDPQHVLLFENETGMDCDVAVTAWAHGMLCKSFSPAVFDAVRAFTAKYRDQAPERVA